MKVREAKKSDFDKVHILLKRLNDSTFSKCDWAKITRIDFNAKNKYYGYVLEDGMEILGFIGTIFSKRSFNGDVINYCNIHSWIIDPKVKLGGLTLLLKVLKLEDHVITNFTASEEPYKIFKSLKFKEVDFKNYKLLPLQTLKMLLNIKIQSINDKNAEKLLQLDQLLLYNDHKRFENVQFLYLNNGGEASFIITKREAYNPKVLLRIPFLRKFLTDKLFLAEIHYISNPKVFFQVFSTTRVALKICRRLGAVGLLVSDRYLSKNYSLKKHYYPRKRPYLFKYAEKDYLVDTLYSELFILNF